jgi:hypothetical protein
VKHHGIMEGERGSTKETKEDEEQQPGRDDEAEEQHEEEEAQQLYTQQQRQQMMRQQYQQSLQHPVFGYYNWEEVQQHQQAMADQARQYG